MTSAELTTEDILQTIQDYEGSDDGVDGVADNEGSHHVCDCAIKGNVTPRGHHRLYKKLAITACDQCSTLGKMLRNPFCFIVQEELLKCGDIESNPGPNMTEKEMLQQILLGQNALKSNRTQLSAHEKQALKRRCFAFIKLYAYNLKKELPNATSLLRKLRALEQELRYLRQLVGTASEQPLLEFWTKIHGYKDPPGTNHMVHLAEGAMKLLILVS
ncbi:hypothetical protein HPB50_025182 [Hyalomma asiaticum]|uniref:Uncharacterized protein n=1 Tax=Hyalomma asiaticum TaxID=266040 RepID=A0ACB7TN40_HYAAI|nr:hypothetical protein HPB50_025182 [Hyalomma asiaticum]